MSVIPLSASKRESLGKLLRNSGYEITFAADGQEAIEKFDAGQTNLVLLDLQMPNKSGRQKRRPKTRRQSSSVGGPLNRV